MKAEFAQVPPKVGLVIGAVLILAGILFTGWKAARVAEEVASYRWPKVEASLESADFFSKRENRGSSGKIVHYGEFSYRYTVDGVEYTGTRYDAGGRMRTGRNCGAAAVEEQFKDAATITVVHHPDKPARSMINPGISEDTSVRLVFTLFLTGVGLIVVRYQWRRLKAGEE